MVEKCSAAQAAAKIKNGDTILLGGFYGYGAPQDVIEEILKQGITNLTVIVNEGGLHGLGAGPLIEQERISKLICSWCGSTPRVAELEKEGMLELELCPQGNFVERIRAGGFGLGGVLTPTGLNTLVEEKWGERVFLNGQEWLYQPPIRGNVALIEAWRADESGNLIFKHTQRNFNTVMAYAADLVIVSVVNPIEPVGSFEPDEIMVPGVVVDVLVQQKGA